MTSISTVGQQEYMQALLQRVRGDLFRTQEQVTTGKKAGDFAGLGADPGVRSMSMRAQLSRLDSYTSIINRVEARAGVMDKAITGINDAARDVRTTMLGLPRINVPPPVEQVRTAAQKALETVVGRLNTTFEDRYIFSASDISNEPIDDVALLHNEAITQINAYTSGAATGAQVLANMNALTLGQMGYSAALSAGTTQDTRVMIDQSVEIDYTLRADEQGFQDILKGLALLANIQYEPGRPDDYWAIYDGAVDLLDRGTRAMDGKLGEMGSLRNQMEEIAITHEQSRLIIDKGISDVEDVDIAQAVTDVNNLQLQLEASYRALAQLQNFNLMNYL